MIIDANLLRINGTMTIVRVAGKSFDDRFREWYATAYRIAWRILTNDQDAQDAVSEGGIRFVRALSRVENEEAPARSFFFRCVQRASLDILRKRRGSDQLTEEQESTQADPNWEKAFEDVLTGFDATSDPEKVKLFNVLDELRKARPTGFRIVTLRLVDVLEWEEIASEVSREVGKPHSAEAVRKNFRDSLHYAYRRYTTGKPIPPERSKSGKGEED